jgi:16S rRNA G1207 methylase RsmC
MNNFKPYFKKDILYNYCDKTLRFHVSQSLFSSYDIDRGTDHLLKTLKNIDLNKDNKVLDLGCGYGPIGIALGSCYEKSMIHMVDKDALAVEFSQRNVKFNKLNRIKTYASLGYDDIVDTDFNLIVSNIPAKAGRPVITYFLEEARFYLSPDGQVAIVVVKELSDYVAKALNSNKNIKVIFEKSWPAYSIWHYKFLEKKNIKPKATAFARNIYRHGKQNISVEGVEISIETAYGLPEFNSLSYETEMILDKLKKLQRMEINQAVIFNPKQGIIPTVLTKIAKVKKINLIDRDLEALRMSKKNLISNGFSPTKISLFHTVGLSKISQKSVELAIGILDEKDEVKVHLMLVKEAHEHLLADGLLILASASTPISRIESFVRKEKLFEVVERQRSKGKSVIILKRRRKK